jgi:hypothetical protein
MCCEENLKIFLRPSPPTEKRKSYMVVEPRISKVTSLSIQKISKNEIVKIIFFTNLAHPGIEWVTSPYIKGSIRNSALLHSGYNLNRYGGVMVPKPNYLNSLRLQIF